ncbi:MAG: HDOD domain-containing protein [Gammaproteobacteria bacterium]|nr:HDOD domain-containing protein [Gammaproteobacteria bacterium]
MSTSITVRRYLDKQDVRYTTTVFDGALENLLNKGNDRVNPAQIAKAVVLKDLRGMLMAVLPGPNQLNIDALNRQLHRNLKFADTQDYQTIFADCAPGILPPLGEAYGFETVVDDGLLDQDLIYFVSGNNNELVRISGYDFQLLHSNAWYGNAFSSIASSGNRNTQQGNAAKTASAPDLKKRLSQLEMVPKIPALTQKLIQLNTNPYAHGEDLVKLLEGDAGLSEQIIRYAQTAPYMKNTSVSTIRQVITRGLSYDVVKNFGLGISATRAFKITAHGPLGLQAFWRHATYSATLIHGLCQTLPRKQNLQPGTAVLCGLLHNIGYLVFGYLFPKEFAALNIAYSETPDNQIIELEQRKFGITHTELGCWLLDAWSMPAELIAVAAEHHNGGYAGPHREYARLVYLTDILLKQHNIGDATDDETSNEFLQSVGLTRQQLNTALEKTIQGSNELDNMARQLAA